MLRIGVNGYGTIGKRVADAVAEMPDMELVGVSKSRPNHTADAARRRGYAVYAPEERHDDFEAASIPAAGVVEDLIADSEIVVDATPAGMGAQYRPVYAEHDTPAIFQGGESAEVAETSFTAPANYEEAIGQQYVRIVSCNTTGLNRTFAPLIEAYGIERADVTLVRCRGDHAVIKPDPTTLPSHHGPDALEVLPEIGEIQTMGMKVPTIRHHVHSLTVTLNDSPDAAAVRDLLSEQSRIHVIPEQLGIESGWDLQEYALDRGRDRMNLYENQIWGESITTNDEHLSLFQSIHRESDVVPENVDAIRAIAGTADAAESIERTNEALGIGTV
jgi:glyceraldehyde-3-phosphate dehydrogenase (NAD(P))